MESQLINSCIWKVEPQDRHCNFCILEHCKDRIPRHKRNGIVLPTLRNMNVGDKVSFSAEEYNAARTAASVAKSTWGSEFTVKKIGLKVYIKRLS